MSKPQKQVAEYFPHDAKHGRTIFILEERYGNDGYAFWFKLLELLAATEGHCIDVGNPFERAYLEAYTRLSGETVTGLLSLLATLDAIDPELYGDNKVWVQKFVDRLEPLYAKRVTEAPLKPVIGHRIPATEGNPSPDTSKVKYSIVNPLGEEEALPQEPVVGLVPTEDHIAAYKVFEERYGMFMPDRDKQLTSLKNLFSWADEVLRHAGNPGMTRGAFVQLMMDSFMDLKDEDGTPKGFWRESPYLPSRLWSLKDQVLEHVRVKFQDNGQSKRYSRLMAALAEAE